MTSARVLVVEDERNIRLFVAAVLRQKGCEVVEASNGREALNTIRQNPHFDAVVTDLKMPELSGKALVRELGEQYPEIPIIVMSAYMSEDWDADDSTKTYIALPKPFTHSQLVESLDQALQQ
jgi:DNA-binding NtrC family response regulator